MPTPESMKELTKKRGSFKGQLTYFINFCLELKPPLTSIVTRELQSRLARIEGLYDRFDEVQLKIECLVDDDAAAQVQSAARADFDSQYHKALAVAHDMLGMCIVPPTGSIKSEVSHRQLVQLPTIQLPKFDGSYENWIEFRDTFASLIHSNDDMDDISKFHYLRTSLESSAQVVIQSIGFSASNYNVAWKLLCERFDNKRLLLQNHIASLFTIEKIVKESFVSLKRLIDHVKRNLQALAVLGEPVDTWDLLLIYIISGKLDQKTSRQWEEYKGRLDDDKCNKFSEFMKFLCKHANFLESLELAHTHHTQSNSKVKSMVSIQQNTNKSSSPTDSSSKILCPKCKGDHILPSCSQFLALSTEARLKLLPTLKVCFNCLKSGHFANRCRKPGCSICKRRHNSLVHLADHKPTVISHAQNDNVVLPENVPSALPNAGHSDQTLAAKITSSEQLDVLLSTALVKTYDNNNKEHVVRAVLDSGSTSCIITERLCSQLNLTPHHIDRSILGINNVTSHVGKTCRVSIKSLNDNFSSDFYCFVLPCITNDVPSHDIDISDLKIPSDICLADPTFYKPAAIDMLLGADLFWDLLGSQRKKLGDKKPMLYETKLGWIISGPVSGSHISLLTTNSWCYFIKSSDDCDSPKSECEFDCDLTRFWQLEEINSPSSCVYSPEEKLCEEHFIKNTTRLEDGRFCVRIPLKRSPTLLGNSLKRATQCYLSLERRLKLKPDLGEMYRNFMSEYESLGHMSACEQPISSTSGYFIPHHGVRRDQSTTTKLRVVFNASSSTSSGISLNDLQIVGPSVQDDLLSILLRFRQHKYILSADVEKMYRQIVVHPSDRCLQQILWRNKADEPMKVFQLNTVTYGTASAPYLATRCLKQISLECNDDKIAEIIAHDFYVDDLLTGGDDLAQVLKIRKQVTAALASAGMPLRKWQSNEPQLVSDDSHTPLDLNIGSHESSKLLGLGWYADSDELCFPIGLVLPKGNTKRDLLSAIARIFDPIGLLAPAVVSMKILLQKLWLQKLSWDEPLGPEIYKHWNDILKTLPLINAIRIPRIVVCNSYKVVQLHICTDASELAYGACAYVRSTNDNGEVMVRLLLAKSRVAPIKPTTIPRLELCGALIGTRLYEKIVKSLRMPISEVCFWTDSTIVLGWLQMLPSKLQPFVRNCVAEVLDKAGSCSWRHIPTELNPADLLSRGLDISSLQTSTLWWTGPEFLSYEPIQVPSQPKSVAILPETKPNVSLTAVTGIIQPDELINISRFSNYLRLIRTVAYVLKWIDCCKKQPAPSSVLTETELRRALYLIIRQCQRESFLEYNILCCNKELPKKSSLLKFNIYLDEHKILRVGGRLDNSDYNYSKKHPILLQSSHIFTHLLFEFEHRRLMHAGPQLLLASIRETYWPIGGRSLARHCYRKCVRCSRMAGKIATPLMGNLPRQRVSSTGFPFENVGVDYAGPIMSATRQGRGCRLAKVYIAVFVCFSTKAIHLELVGDLTSNLFLMALHRFVSRRGKPLNLYSDNGTSFVGAYNDLAKFLKQNCNSVGESVANEGIKFHFIPAYSPHMGGLWEAGVKSTKYHLQRVLGNCHLTYEELNTTLIQIEGILNSRPLTPLSSDPADCSPLTPGHFIIGRPLTCLPQPNYEARSTNYLSRFQRIEQLRQHFWARWSKEYIAELQLRVKWRSCKDSLQLNTLVVVKEDHLPPLKWKLGRIVAVHPGPDGIARVADIRTSAGVIRRSFSKICPLPVSG